jgi:hypothetical protein
VSCSPINDYLLAHEVGHAQGLWHPESTKKTPCWPYPGDYTIKETGFDPAAKSVKSASTSDFMSISGVDPANVWISPFMWNMLLKTKFTKDWAYAKTGCASPAPPASAEFSAPSLNTVEVNPPDPQPQPALLVSGSVRRDGTGRLDALYQISHTGPLAIPQPDAPYCLDWQSQTGALVVQHCFDLDFSGSESQEDKSQASFSFALPFPADARRLVLRHGPTVLAERVASAHAPEVTVLAPTAGAMIAAATTISWAASDQDGDPLTYAVQYSTDGGTSWWPMGFDIGGTSLDVDSIHWAGSSAARVRIIASDGFNSTSANSAPFQVPGKPPLASISTPQDKALLHPYEAVVLTGHGSDLENGELRGMSLTWRSDRQGILGHGAQVVLPGMALQPGRHEITLTAVDSDGMVGSATISILVGYRVDLPVIMKNLGD